MRTLVRFEYDIENVKLFDTVWRRGASAVRSRAGG